MSTPPNNQNTLFKFISLRAPEKSMIYDIDLRFVFHPYGENMPGSPDSHFYDAIASMPETTVWEALQDAADTFNPYASEDEVKSINPDMYLLAETYHYFKSATPIDGAMIDLYNNLTPLTVLTESEELSMWDNLFYQVITQQSYPIKEILMKMIIVNHMAKWAAAHTLPESLNLMYWINARVVLPLVVFGNDQASSSLLAKNSGVQYLDLNPYPSQAIKEEKTHIKAKMDAELYEQMTNSLKKAKKKFALDVQEEYDVQYKTYQEEISETWTEYLKAIETAKFASCPIEGNPAHYCNQVQVVEPVIEPFVFDYDIDETDNMDARLTEEEYEVYNKFHQDEDFTSLQQAIDFFETMAKKERKTVFSKNKFSRKVTVLGDAFVPVEETARLANFTFQICSTKNRVNGKYNPYMVIQVPDPSYDILSGGIVYKIWYTNATSTTDGTFEKEISGNVITLMNLFGVEDGWELPMALTIEKITGTITFANGVKKKFEVPDFIIGQDVCSTGKLIDEVTTPTPGPQTNAYVPKGFGYRQLGIADYRKVVQEICCYDAGEVAHIENIMASEYKERTTEKIYTKETSVFESLETETESLSDTTSAQRFEIQSEIAKILQEQRQNESHINVTATYSDVTLDAGASFAASTSKEESNKQAIKQSKEITERAMERIVSRTKSEKTVKITESFKDINSHIYDNRGATSHVSGVYRFVNAVYKNQVLNYGKRLMYEFMIPEPSRLHRLALHEANTLTEPIDPRIAITDYTSLSVDDYVELATQYDAEIKMYPAPEIILSKIFTGGTDIYYNGNDTAPTGGNSKETIDLEIPEGYETVHALIEADAVHNGNAIMYDSFGFAVGNLQFFHPKDTRTGNGHPHPALRYIKVDTETNPAYQLRKFSKTISLGYQSLNNTGFNITFSIKCKLTDYGIAKWKKETFEAIVNGYEEQLRVYNDKKAEAKAGGLQILDSNPLFYRQIEQMVLRKNCISYLIDDSANSPRRMGQDMYNSPASFSNAQVLLTQEMDNYCSMAKFMEQAFEWNNISYNFYPYYWGSKANWADLYKFETNDATFRSFMQAGLARVVVTVKPGFEDAVLHYMAFGQIWNGGQMPVLGDPLYLSIVDELREPEYTIAETWETVMPTNLIAIQSSGVALDGTGLPCATDCVGHDTNPFSDGPIVLTPAEPLPPEE